MKILAIGCSFTYGVEMPDCDQANNRPSQNTWANVIARQCNAELVNMSMGGGSNPRLFRIAVAETVNQYDLILCQWSDVVRLDLLNPDGTELQTNPNSLHYMKIYPWLNNYFKYHVTVEDSWVKWITMVIALQNHFLYTQQKYLFLSMNSPHYSVHYPPKYAHLIKQIDTSRFVGFAENEGMVDWQSDCPKGPGGHPLELGHQRIADRVYRSLLDLGYVS